MTRLDEATYKKLMRLKEEKGFGEKDWSEFFAYLSKNIRLEELSGEKISRATKENLMELWVQNFADNLPYIRKGKTIAELVPKEPEKTPKGPAVVVGAGPSVWKHNHLKLLAETEKAEKLAVIVTDRMVIPCLKAGVVPDKYEDWVAVGVDGAEIIKKWWDDPIVAEYGEKIKAAIITSTHPKVRKILQKNKVQVYWYSPIYDDYRDNESYTRLQMIMTKSKKNPRGCPSLSCLGHAGGAAYALSFALLRRSPIALIGENLGWDEGTPLEKTQYFSTFLEAAGGNVNLVTQAYKTIYNPYFKCKAIVDPVFNHYREAMVEAQDQVPAYVETYNATEGGCLFGKRIYCIKFKDFLKHCDEPDELKRYVLEED